MCPPILNILLIDEMKIFEILPPIFSAFLNFNLGNIIKILNFRFLIEINFTLEKKLNLKCQKINKDPNYRLPV